MIGAYHVGYREMWNVLLARADEREPQIAAHLVRVVDLWWTWIRLISSASADAHAETLRSQHAVQITMTHRFLEILRAGEDPSGEAVHLARALTFDPDGSFQAVCFLLPSRPRTGSTSCANGCGGCRARSTPPPAERTASCCARPPQPTW